MTNGYKKISYTDIGKMHLIYVNVHLQHKNPTIFF